MWLPSHPSLFSLLHGTRQHYSNAFGCWRKCTVVIPPRDLFRNIWDPDELSKLVQTSEECIKNVLRTYRGHFIHSARLRQAAAQFEKMGQRSSAEETNRRAMKLRALEKLGKSTSGSIPTRSSPLHELDHQSTTNPSQVVTRFLESP